MYLRSLIALFSLGMLISACQTSNPSQNSMISYPETRKDSVVDTYFGTEVPDPYRWLEDDRAAETEAWVKDQNAVTKDYLAQIPYRESLEDRLTELLNYPRVSSPRKVGEVYFFSKNDGLQNQAVIYVQKGLDAEPEVFIDPNKLSENGTVAIGLLGASEDNTLMAYSRSEAGSDWSTIRIKDIATGEDLDDQIDWVKFSGTSWYGDGFFYSGYPKPAEGTEFSATSEYQSVYFHKLGTPQSADLLIYTDSENPNRYHNAGLTEDKQYMILYKRTGTDGFETWYKPTDLKQGGFKPIYEGFGNKTMVIDHHQGNFILMTDVDAPNYRVVTAPVRNPIEANWKDLIPQQPEVLQGITKAGGRLFASYLKDATSRIYHYNYEGEDKKELPLPGIGSAGVAGGKKEDTQIFYAFSSYVQPPSIFSYDLTTDESKLFFQPELKFNPEDFTVKQEFFESKDGTKVPIFIVHQKGLELDGDRPTYLYAYGGFNISLTPSFSASTLVLLENGGVFAVANLRGGGEYGEEWHQAGMLDKKQNVFDDFIAAAEHLIDQKYTRSERLAIAGGSNGGLLVGACMTQRPDLYAVCFPAVGVMDMLRYHKFTVGWGWVPEYGNAENSEAEFQNLYSYSPLHNLKPGVSYPATMVTTADHDDRVVPAHSFKYAAQLQASHEGSNPVLIRIETDAGHGAGKPISKIIEEQADKWAFMFYNMGLTPEAPEGPSLP